LASRALALARDGATKPAADTAQAALVRAKGDEHERRYLEQLRADGKSVLEIPFDFDWEAAAAATADAIRAAEHEVIYQGCLASGGWRGFADFLERTPAGSYEAVDTKLAR